VSRDVLEDALSEYPGAIVLITHDRHLIRSIANHIVEVLDGKVTHFPGDYDYYLESRSREAVAPPVSSGPRSSGGPKGKDRRRQEAEARARTKTLRDKIRAIEAELDSVGAELQRLEGVLADPGVYQSDVDVKQVVQEYERAKKRTEALESSWHDATSRLDELGVK
jgi:ATP-binding cassette subfamily F protein 3